MTDISARENKVLDINGDPCALVKIYTGIKGLEIDGNRGVEKKDERSGVVWVWLPEGTRQLKISKERMPMLVYPLPMELKKSTVYSFELSSDQLFSVIINTGNVDANVFINDSTFKTNTTISGLLEEEYPIRIEKLGYLVVEDTIAVNESNLYFAYTLEQSKQAVLKINSDPDGAVVLMDGEHIGFTNFSGYRFPGEYHLQITMKDYITIDTTIVFDPAIQSTFSFKIIKNTGWLNAIVKPSGSMITIDGVSVLPGIKEINAGTGHNIIVIKQRYRAFSEAFEVPRGDTLLINVTLVHQQGDFSFVINPDDADINLAKEIIMMYFDEEFKEKKWSGNNQLRMPEGRYSLEAKRKGYLKIDTTFIINDAKTTYMSMTLPPKKLRRGSAIALSVLFPGMGQFYSQRNGAGAGYFTAGLLSSAATGYYFLLTEGLAKDYNDAKSAYLNESNIGSITYKREEMDNAYQSYQDAVKTRDLCIGITAGIWFVNIVDAAVFAKMYKPVLQGSIGNDGSYRLAASPGINSIGASFSIRF
ncbi:PEGA domain-containing protein [bacterium]|nr:PEGA domain-containing protein [bacterium]